MFWPFLYRKSKLEIELLINKMCLWKEDNNVNCCCLWNIQSYKKKEEKKDYKTFTLRKSQFGYKREIIWKYSAKDRGSIRQINHYSSSTVF